MISTIVHPKQLEKATVRIACCGERGSGFFVREAILLTARHVVQDHIDESHPIEVILPTTENGELQSFKAKLVKEDSDLDIALIALDGPPPGDSSLPLSDTKLRYDEEWETFGWPSAQLTNGGRYHGKVTKTNTLGVFDIELSCDDIQKGYNYGGLSGSAVLVHGKVVGVIISQLLNDHLGAVSVGKLKQFLISSDVPITEPRSHDEIPDELRDEVEKSVSNDVTLGELEKKLGGGGGKFYLLYGSPGSGKTVLVASFQPRIKGIEIVGKYFVRFPNDPRPLSFRASNETLLQWLEFLISKKISGAAPPNSDLNVNKRTERLSSWLQELNRYYHERNIIGVIIIDGLDDVPKGGISIEKFLAIFPENLPSNITTVRLTLSKHL